MKFKVELMVDVDLDEWTDEYDTTGAGESLAQVLNDLRSLRGYRLEASELITVTSVKATALINLTSP